MANRFIIDDENISVNNVLNFSELKRKDKIYIVSNGSKRLNLAVLQELLNKKARIKILLINAQGKDFADKLIVFLMGKFYTKKGKIFIVTNDKFYDDAIEFYNSIKPGKFQKLSLLAPLKTKSQTPEKSPLKEPKISTSDAEKIKSIASASANLMDFHNALAKNFGNKKGAEIYAALKQKAKEFFAKKPLAIERDARV